MKVSKLRSLVVAATAMAAPWVVACGSDGSSPVAGGADTTAPQPVNDLSLAYDSVHNTLVFTWHAPRDDARHERVDHYEARYSDSFPFDWEHATAVDDPPPAAAPGVAQQMVVTAPARHRDFYASVRAVDAAGNTASVGSVAHARVPGYALDFTFADALSGAPLAGMDATVTTPAATHFVTGADGRLVFSDVTADSVTVTATGGSAGAYHAWSASFAITGDVSRVIPMIKFEQPESPLYASILALLKDAIFSPGGKRVIRRWHNYPALFYSRDFVNTNALDYTALLQQAAERWNTRLGFQMFAVTDADPATGILVEFLSRSTMGTVNGVTEYSPGADGYPQHDRIRVVDDLADGPKLYEIFMHELGHTIPLVHLPAGFIMYGSQPLPNDISDDEVTMVQLLVALPNGTVLDEYDQTPPAR
jgi:hypothetical protein